MKPFEKYLAHKKAIVITLDDALFPKKDYLLQVYYLFAEFMAYTEQSDAKPILDFMSSEYLRQGEVKMFENTASKFSIPQKYQQNFDLLHKTAKLPLKLLLFKQVLQLLKTAVARKINIFILAEGSPEVAINKIKQLEWNTLEQYLKVYFTAEYENSASLTLTDLLEAESFSNEEVVLFTSQIQFEGNFVNNQVNCFSVAEIL